MRSRLIVPLLLLASSAFGQLVVVPIARTPSRNSDLQQARTQASSTPIPLPFWDDFSFSNSPYYPHDTIYQYGHSVSLNDGISIHAPSLGAVTFDGLDSLGKPYDVTNILAKGFADKLISRPISMSQVAADQRDSVYFSFYYQYEGNGEPPDPGDYLNLDFKNHAGQWINMAQIVQDVSLKADSFNIMMIHITDTSFFHDDFQFRFRNYGRLSGPYDTWSVDYLFLNAHRYANDFSFPDRTVATRLSNLFGLYSAMPIKHFFKNTSSITHPSVGLHNLEYLPGNGHNLDVQPINYDSRDSIVVFKDSTSTATVNQLDQTATIGNPLQPLEFRTFSLGQLPSRSSIDSLADSVYVHLKLKINSGDFVSPTPSDPDGDYDSVKYYPIDFRVNDYIESINILSNFYAYDDGTAEYGIGLNQPGAQVTYRFDMQTPDPDTVVAVDFYFPHFGDESSQIIKLRILKDTTDSQQSILYEENISVIRSEQNKFIRHQLDRNTVGVQGSFYLGWYQSSAAVIPIGWDKNTDSGDRIYYNTNDSWVPNTIEHGSMMIRPVFGKGGVVAGLPDVPDVNAFPNPSPGTFYLSTATDRVEIFDLAGRAVSFSSEVIDQRTRIEMHSPNPGLYILKTISNQKVVSQKIMVRP